MASPPLLSPLTMRGVTFRNRIVVSPMCQYSSEDGFATDWHLVHLGSRAVGGAALVITEASAVEARGRISPQDLGIWKDAHIDPLARITRFLREHGAAAGIQLAHAGRKASVRRPWESGPAWTETEGGWIPVAPSPIPFADGYAMPQELDAAGVRQLIADFSEAARRSVEAGFQMVEIHAAHGYLLHEFLSPVSNQRTDGYGGSFENRIRLVCEVTEAVRAVLPDKFPVFVRLSCTDWLEEGGSGWDIEQSVELSRRLKTLGVDLIDCSSGGNVAGVSIPIGPGYQTPFAERIRKEAGIATGAVGMILSPAQADHVIRTGQADMILLARELLRDPHWPLRAAKELHSDASPVPNQYARAW